MQNSVCRQSVTVNLELGLHLRPLSQIAKAARQHESCDVRVLKEDYSVDAKNVLELMTLNAPLGTQLTLEATGESAAEVIEELVRLFASNFEDDTSEPSAS
jgi:phosphotransferase system HPr (HPr) family protein